MGVMPWFGATSAKAKVAAPMKQQAKADKTVFFMLPSIRN